MVLMIDMDFRNPSIGRYMGMRNQKDTLDYINKRATFDDIAFTTSVRNLAMIDASHKSAVSVNVIQSTGFRRLIEEARKRYSYVILDTPPLGMFVDAAVLSKHTDGVLLVVASGRVERELAREVVDQLGKADAKALGVALNFINRKSGNEYRYRGSRYYRKYYAQSGKGQTAL